jgi:hypothetical protein
VRLAVDEAHGTNQDIDALAQAAQKIGDVVKLIHYTSAVAASVQQQTAATGEISQNVASAADGAKLIVTVLNDAVSTVCADCWVSVAAPATSAIATVAALLHELAGLFG